MRWDKPSGLRDKWLEVQAEENTQTREALPAGRVRVVMPRAVNVNVAVVHAVVPPAPAAAAAAAAAAVASTIAAAAAASTAAAAPAAPVGHEELIECEAEVVVAVAATAAAVKRRCEVLTLGPGIYHPPRRTMAFNARNDCSDALDDLASNICHSLPCRTNRHSRGCRPPTYARRHRRRCAVSDALGIQSLLN